MALVVEVHASLPCFIHQGLVITRAACFGLLKYFMKGASGVRTYFSKNRTKVLLSRRVPCPD
jgi:hypothetical protein